MQYIFFKVINRLFSLLKFINSHYFNGSEFASAYNSPATLMRYNFVSFVNYLRVLYIISLGVSYRLKQKLNILWESQN